LLDLKPLLLELAENVYQSKDRNSGNKQQAEKT